MSDLIYLRRFAQDPHPMDDGDTWTALDWINLHGDYRFLLTAVTNDSDATGTLTVMLDTSEDGGQHVDAYHQQTFDVGPGLQDSLEVSPDITRSWWRVTVVCNGGTGLARCEVRARRH